MKKIIFYTVLVAISAISFMIAGHTFSHKKVSNSPIDKREFISSVSLTISQETLQSAKITTAMTKIRMTDNDIALSCQNGSDDLKSIKKEQANNINKFTRLYSSSLLVDQTITQAVNNFIEAAIANIKSTKCQQVTLLIDPDNLSQNIYDLMLAKIMKSEKLLDNLTGQHRSDSELRNDAGDMVQKIIEQENN